MTRFSSREISLRTKSLETEGEDVFLARVGRWGKGPSPAISRSRRPRGGRSSKEGSEGGPRDGASAARLRRGSSGSPRVGVNTGTKERPGWEVARSSELARMKAPWGAPSAKVEKRTNVNFPEREFVGHGPEKGAMSAKRPEKEFVKHYGPGKGAEWGAAGGTPTPREGEEKVKDNADGVAYTRAQLAEFYGEKKADKIFRESLAPEPRAKADREKAGTGMPIRFRGGSRGQRQMEPVSWGQNSWWSGGWEYDRSYESLSSKAIWPVGGGHRRASTSEGRGRGREQEKAIRSKVDERKTGNRYDKIANVRTESETPKRLRRKSERELPGKGEANDPERKADKESLVAEIVSGARDGENLGGLREEVRRQLKEAKRTFTEGFASPYYRCTPGLLFGPCKVENPGEEEEEGFYQRIVALAWMGGLKRRLRRQRAARLSPGAQGRRS